MPSLTLTWSDNKGTLVRALHWLHCSSSFPNHCRRCNAAGCTDRSPRLKLKPTRLTYTPTSQLTFWGQSRNHVGDRKGKQPAIHPSEVRTRNCRSRRPPPSAPPCQAELVASSQPTGSAAAGARALTPRRRAFSAFQRVARTPRREGTWGGQRVSRSSSSAPGSEFAGEFIAAVAKMDGWIGGQQAPTSTSGSTQLKSFSFSFREPRGDGEEQATATPTVFCQCHGTVVDLQSVILG